MKRDYIFNKNLEFSKNIFNINIILYAVVFFIISLFFINIANAAYIQDNATGGDCGSIGIWDQNTKTCVLTTDVNDFVAIEMNMNLEVDKK